LRASVLTARCAARELLRAAHQAHGLVDQLAGEHRIGFADRDGQAIAGFGLQAKRAGGNGQVVGRLHIPANSRIADGFHISSQVDSARPDPFKDEGEAFGDADLRQQDHIIPERRIGGRKPVILGDRRGEIVLPLAIGDEQFGPGRGEEDGAGVAIARGEIGQYLSLVRCSSATAPSISPRSKKTGPGRARAAS